ncbi:hypothetical protein ACVIJ6_003015 [Bradyrhizobium sp. USDA 4369]
MICSQVRSAAAADPADASVRRSPDSSHPRPLLAGIPAAIAGGTRAAATVLLVLAR